jgi:hypothetical protein
MELTKHLQLIHLVEQGPKESEQATFLSTVNYPVPHDAHLIQTPLFIDLGGV